MFAEVPYDWANVLLECKGDNLFGVPARKPVHRVSSGDPHFVITIDPFGPCGFFHDPCLMISPLNPWIGECGKIEITSAAKCVLGGVKCIVIRYYTVKVDNLSNK